MLKTSSRRLRLLGATGTIRTAMFQEKEHLVVPIVALVEGVVWAVNSPQPELVLAEELAVAPQGWNGRPVVGDHPDVDGQKISANSPEVLESLSFGHLFNSHVEKDRLLMEAWLDPAKAKQVGPEAEAVISRARAGEMIEISTGAFISLEERKGIHKGKNYSAIWRGIVPDHLAMLPEGITGACSVEMGCGAPRSACAYLVTAQGLLPAEEAMPDPDPVEEIPKRSLKERLFDLMTFRGSKGTATGVSDADLRGALEKALRAEEPGFMGVDYVYPEDSLVIFSAMPADKWQMVRRDYSVKSDGAVKLGSTREEVVPVTTFEAAMSGQPPKCGCAPKGAEEMDKAQRISALISGSNGKYLETDKPWLENIPEDRLAALEVKAADPSHTPTPQAPPPPPSPSPEPKKEEPKKEGHTPSTLEAGASKQTAEQFIASAPAEIQESLREGLRISSEKRQGVINALKATNRFDFTDVEIAARSTCELERFLKLADVPAPVTFAGLGLPRVSSANEGVPPPPDMVGEMRASAKK